MEKIIRNQHSIKSSQYQESKKNLKILPKRLKIKLIRRIKNEIT